MIEENYTGASNNKHRLRDSLRWSLGIIDSIPAEPFCDICQINTVPVATGNLFTFNLIGETFIGRSNACPRGGSVESYMFFMFFVPIIPLGKWKVKYLSRRRFLARKIMNSSFPDMGRQHVRKRNRVLVPLLLLLFLVLVFGVGAVILLNPIPKH